MYLHSVTQILDVLTNGIGLTLCEKNSEGIKKLGCGSRTLTLTEKKMS